MQSMYLSLICLGEDICFDKCYYSTCPFDQLVWDGFPIHRKSGCVVTGGGRILAWGWSLELGVGVGKENCGSWCWCGPELMLAFWLFGVRFSHCFHIKRF